ncbi:hypothetical protein J1N35_039226 [Gossypium stocksii]|uniref:Uncharacterized protein n=1 Tax=Gossypium stocksii TaxID=47602 RepID=A0A9D3UND8_9ROSI|nr:hypothetical protein J1N35_039226 [Gossypium stocksii]
MKFAIQKLDKEALTRLLVVLWQLWNAQNMELYQGNVMVPQDAVFSAWTLQKNFRIHNRIQAPLLPRRPKVVK